jgi:probable HAF family extracellular repeat protein
MRAARRLWGLTLFSLGIFHIPPVQAQQYPWTDQAAEGSAPQGHHKHHHYKLEVIPSLGGRQANFFDPTNNIAVLNNQGAASGGDADTLMPDRFPNYLWGDAFMVAHAYVWKNGVLTDLGAVDDSLSSYSAWISSNGIVAGVSEKAEFDPLVPGIVDPSVPDYPEATAVIWRNGKITDLGFLPGGGYESRAVSVNSRGEVVGSATNLVPDANSFAFDSVFLLTYPYGYQSRAFIWDSKEGMRDLGTLGTGLDAAAYAINEQGEVIGYSYKDTTTPGGCTSLGLTTAVLDMGAFIWDRQHGMRDLGNFGGTCTFAGALNNHGQVVGASNVSGDRYQRPFLWEKGVLRDLGGSLGGKGAGATRINERGEVVGSANLPGEATFHATLWRGVGHMTDLGTVDHDLCAFAWAINDKTQIVGISSGSDCVNFNSSRPFLWENGSMVDLNTLVPPNSPLHLFYAYTINNRGEIAGNGFDADGHEHAFVLIPCDEDHPKIAGCDYENSPTAAD